MGTSFPAYSQHHSYLSTPESQLTGPEFRKPQFPYPVCSSVAISSDRMLEGGRKTRYAQKFLGVTAFLKILTSHNSSVPAGRTLPGGLNDNLRSPPMILSLLSGTLEMQS